MTRILADLPDDDIERLDRIARQQGKSRAAVLREAVAAYNAQPHDGDAAWLELGFGLWTRHGIASDPADADRCREAEWTRYWDDDFDDIAARSPDRFDHEDLRQRQVFKAMTAGNHPLPGKAKRP